MKLGKNPAVDISLAIIFRLEVHLLSFLCSPQNQEHLPRPEELTKINETRRLQNVAPNTGYCCHGQLFGEE